jgi:hypothetical protein
MSNQESVKSKIDLADYKWQNRLIFIFAPSKNHPGYQAKKSEIESQIPEIIDRDLVIFELFEDGESKVGDSFLDAEAVTFLRENFQVQPGKFTVILVGKDGGEKLRGDDKVSLTEIFSLIDAMPMRQQEMKEQA